MPRGRGGGSSSRSASAGSGDAGGTQASFSGGTTGTGSDGRSSREKRRQEGAQALEGDLIKDIEAEMTLSEAVGKDVTGSITGIEGGQLNGIGEADAAQKESLRRGAAAASFPGLDKLGVFGAIASSVASENVDRTLSELGVDVESKKSLSSMGKIGISVAQEVTNLKTATEFGASVKDLALGTVANPSSVISGLVGRTIGKFGAKFSATPSFDEATDIDGGSPTGTGRDIAERRTDTGSVIDTGSAAPVRSEATETAASLTDTGEVATRSRSSIDIRRRTRPAAFLGGNFSLGARELTG